MTATPLAEQDQTRQRPLTEAGEAFLLSRAISPETAQSAGVWDDGSHIGFPYTNDLNQIIAIKLRGMTEKSFYQKGVCETYFLQPQSLSSDILIITEGEIDALSLREAGFQDVMSCPNGAPQKVSEGKVDPSEDGKFRYVWGAKALYQAAKKVVIWTDADSPGQALGEELARRIGKGRCWRVSPLPDCKDANDVLMKHGPEKLKEVMGNLIPWPVQGVYDALHYEAKVKNIFKGGMSKGQSTGYASLDVLYTVVPGHLTVITGTPGSGKTAFLNQLMVKLAQNLDWKFAIQSTEIEPPIHIAMLCALHTGQPFFDYPGAHNQKLNEQELDAALAWVNDHFTFLESEGCAGVKDTIERLELAVMRYGVRGACIDPASYLRGKSGDGMDVEQVGFMLESFKNFSVMHECCTWLIAHPYKIRQNDDGSSPVPKGYSISGSAHWANRPDCGITIHRPADDRSKTEFHVWKMRYSWVGKEGKSDLYFDLPTGRYTEQPIPRQGPVIYSAYSGEPIGNDPLADMEIPPVKQQVNSRPW